MFGVNAWDITPHKFHTEEKEEKTPKAGGFKSTDIGMKVVCNDADCPPNHMAMKSTDGKGDETCQCIENPVAILVVGELSFWQKVGKLFGVTKSSETFNAFSDESTPHPTKTNQMTSRGIDIPDWTFVEVMGQTDYENVDGIPLEMFERTFVVPFGTIKQTKKVQHPDPANIGAGKPLFGVKIRSELTPLEGDDTPSSFIEKQVEDPFMPDNAQWELSGLDTWFETAEEEEDDSDDEEPEEVAKDVTPPQAESKTGLYILGGIGVLAAGYLYFIIRNPKAYVQGKAISTAGGLVSQALGAEHGS